jgi:cytochrome P450
VSQETLFQQALDYNSRADPYPIYAQLRERPVWREENGTYVVTRYEDVAALLHDPRFSSEDRRRGLGRRDESGADSGQAEGGRMMVALDPPDHDWLRASVNKHFGPPQMPRRVESMRPRIRQIARDLLDSRRDLSRFDIVESLAYPLPVTVICEILGVPREDEPRFHAWSQTLLDFDLRSDSPERQRSVNEVISQLRQYMDGLISAHQSQPGDDLISALATERNPQDRLDRPDLIATGILLLIAGHETTVNLITNGVLTLLRYPDALERLRGEPEFVVPVVEELLRYEPPVHFTVRTTLADVDVADTPIPKGALVFVLLAAANRDPARFDNPDRFDPTRTDNEHLGFGGGIHYCLGAPLARLEAQIALTEFAGRVESPRLVEDPPPYRKSPVLRGPRELRIEVAGIADVATVAAPS